MQDNKTRLSRTPRHKTLPDVSTNNRLSNAKKIDNQSTSDEGTELKSTTGDRINIHYQGDAYSWKTLRHDNTKLKQNSSGSMVLRKNSVDVKNLTNSPKKLPKSKSETSPILKLDISMVKDSPKNQNAVKVNNATLHLRHPLKNTETVMPEGENCTVNPPTTTLCTELAGHSPKIDENKQILSNSISPFSINTPTYRTNNLRRSPRTKPENLSQKCSYTENPKDPPNQLSDIGLSLKPCHKQMSPKTISPVNLNTSARGTSIIRRSPRTKPESSSEKCVSTHNPQNAKNKTSNDEVISYKSCNLVSSTQNDVSRTLPKLKYLRQRQSPVTSLDILPEGHSNTETVAITQSLTSQRSQETTKASCQSHLKALTSEMLSTATELKCSQLLPEISTTQKSPRVDQIISFTRKSPRISPRNTSSESRSTIPSLGIKEGLTPNQQRQIEAKIPATQKAELNRTRKSPNLAVGSCFKTLGSYKSERTDKTLAEDSDFTAIKLHDGTLAETVLSRRKCDRSQTKSDKMLNTKENSVLEIQKGDRCSESKSPNILHSTDKSYISTVDGHLNRNNKIITARSESKQNVRRKIAFPQKTEGDSGMSKEKDDSDEEYIPRRKKLRSEMTESELWEGFPQNVRFKRLTPKKQVVKLDSVTIKMEPGDPEFDSILTEVEKKGVKDTETENKCTRRSRDSCKDALNVESEKNTAKDTLDNPNSHSNKESNENKEPSLMAVNLMEDGPPLKDNIVLLTADVHKVNENANTVNYEQIYKEVVPNCEHFKENDNSFVKVKEKSKHKSAEVETLDTESKIVTPKNVEEDKLLNKTDIQIENVPLVNKKRTKRDSSVTVTPKRSARLQNKNSSTKKKNDPYIYTPLKRQDCEVENTSSLREEIRELRTDGIDKSENCTSDIKNEKPIIEKTECVPRSDLQDTRHENITGSGSKYERTAKLSGNSEKSAGKLDESGAQDESSKHVTDKTLQIEKPRNLFGSDSKIKLVKSNLNRNSQNEISDKVPDRNSETEKAVNVTNEYSQSVNALHNSDTNSKCEEDGNLQNENSENCPVCNSLPEKEGPSLNSNKEQGFLSILTSQFEKIKNNFRSSAKTDSNDTNTSPSGTQSVTCKNDINLDEKNTIKQDKEEEIVNESKCRCIKTSSGSKIHKADREKQVECDVRKQRTTAEPDDVNVKNDTCSKKSVEKTYGDIELESYDMSVSKLEETEECPIIARKTKLRKNIFEQISKENLYDLEDREMALKKQSVNDEKNVTELLIQEPSEGVCSNASTSSSKYPNSSMTPGLSKDKESSDTDSESDSDGSPKETKKIPHVPLKLKMKKTRKGAAIISPKLNDSPFVLLPRISLQNGKQFEDTKLKTKKYSVDEKSKRKECKKMKSNLSKELQRTSTKVKSPKLPVERQLRSSEQCDELSLETSFELGEKTKKSGKVFKQNRKRKYNERSPLKKTHCKAKRRMSSPRNDTKTSEIQRLLANKTLEKHACILWSSGHRRHFQMSNPEASHSEIDDIMRDAWDKMTEKEKIGYFQRAHNAMRDEDKHSTPKKQPTKSIDNEMPEIRPSRKMTKFLLLSPNEQHAELQKWLRLFYEISAGEYSKLMLGFKEILKTQRSKIKENTKEKDADVQGYYRKLLFQKILDARDKIIEIYEQKKERQKLILTEAFDNTVRRLIAGEDLEFTKGTRSEALAEVLLDLRDLETDLKIAVSGAPLKTKSFENVLDNLQQKSTDELTNRSEEQVPDCFNETDVLEADSQYAQQLLQQLPTKELPLLDVDTVDKVLTSESSNIGSFSDDLSRELFQQLSKFFDQEARNTHERLNAGSITSCCELNSPACTLTNWLLADQFRALAGPANQMSRNNRMLIDSKQLVQFLKGTGPYNVVALPASTIPPNIRRGGVRRGRQADDVSNRNNNSVILDKQRHGVSYLSVADRSRIQNTTPVHKVVYRRNAGLSGHTILRYTSTLSNAKIGAPHVSAI